MRSLALAVLVCSICCSSFAQEQWTPLFNGKNLNGWTQRNGSAPFKVENSTIVGVSVMDTPNSFLCTKEEYGDFILEFDALVDPELNSGVQFRSLSLPTYKNGRVHGYQVEIDPSERAWTGGIYDEARRGWLYALNDNEPGRKAFKQNEWNHFRVEAIGSTIRTWLNGIPCSSVEDTLTLKGFIALQVHSIGKDNNKAGKTIRWKDIRILTTNLLKNRMPDDNRIAQQNYIPNMLTSREQKEGWKLLWDGKTTTGWRGAKADRFPEGGWEIKGGVLSVLESGGAESRAGGDIVTADIYGEFELIVDFLITKGANSGIKYFVDTDLNKGEGSAIGCEYQILDDDVHPDAKLGVKGNRKLAGLYDLIPPTNVRFNGIGEWNRARIVSKGNHVEHYLNGMKTVEYDRSTQMWRALVDHSKYHVWPGFGEAKKGHILLQDHGNSVSFRSVKIRELAKER